MILLYLRHVRQVHHQQHAARAQARGEHARMQVRTIMQKIVTLPFDAAALDSAAALLSGKGAAAKAAAILPIVLAVASSIYANGARSEQFFDTAIKNGRARHPAFNALHTGKAPVCRAFRATLAAHGATLTAKGRAMTQEAHDAAMAALAATFNDAVTPAPRKAGDPAALEAAALARAVELVRRNAAAIDADQYAVLAACIAAYDALHAPAPAPAPAPAMATA